MHHAPGCFSISATLPSLMESPMEGTWILMSSCAAAVTRRKRTHDPVHGDHCCAAGVCCQLQQQASSQTSTVVTPGASSVRSGYGGCPLHLRLTWPVRRRIGRLQATVVSG